MRYKRLASLLALLPLLASCRVDSSSSSLESSESLPSSSVEESVPSSSSEAPAPSSSSEASPSSDSTSASPSSEAQSSDAHSSEGQSSAGSSSSEQSSEAPHEHTYSDAWSSDSTDHWHASTCGHAEEIKDKAAHTFTDWTYEDMSDAGTQKKERHCSVCQKKEEKTIDYLHDEDLLKKILSSIYENSTMTVTINGSSEVKTVLTERGAREVQKYGGQTYEYVVEFLSDRYIGYIYHEKLNFWEKSIVVMASGIEGLQEGEDYRSYLLESMWTDISTPLAEALDKVSYDKEKGAFVISTLNFSYDIDHTTVQANLTNVEIKVDEEKLVSIEYDASGDHVVADQIGTSSIDFSFKNNLHTHTFSSAWESDSYGHWHPLTCEHKGKENDLVSGPHTNGSDYARHTFSGESGKCTVCGYECKHRYDSNYDCLDCGYHHEHTQGDGEYHSYDEYYHCKKYGCGHPVEDTRESHNFVDCVCSACGYTKHEYAGIYTYDAEYHWEEMTCSHASTAENATKEEHDFEDFGDYCPACHYLNVSTDASEKVTETQFESALSDLDTSNLTMYRVRESEWGTDKLKFDGNYVNAERSNASSYLRSYEGEKVYDFLTYYESGEEITAKVEDDGCLDRDDYFGSKGEASLLETLKKAKFSDAEWKDGGYYLVTVTECDENEGCEETAKFVVKFQGGKIDLVTWNFAPDCPTSSSCLYDFAFFYDFGTTEVDIPSGFKTYDFAGKYEPSKVGRWHRPVYICDGEETTIWAVDSRCTYERNNDGEYVCAYCGEACEHDFGDSTKCHYCDSLHVHQPGEDDVCTICVQKVDDELNLKDAKTFLNEYEYSFTCETKTERKVGDGEFIIASRDETEATWNAVKGSDESLNDLYYVLEESEGKWRWYCYSQSTTDGVTTWSKGEEYRDAYREKRDDLCSLFTSKSFEKSEAEENTYVWREAFDDHSCECSMVIVNGELISCKVVTTWTEKDKDDETVTITYRKTTLYSDFNSTVVTLPDFGL